MSLLAAWYRRAQDRAARSAMDLVGPAEEAAAPRRAPHRLGGAPGAVPRRVSLRRWLALLALGTALPLLLFAVVVLVWLVGGYRADQDRRHADTTRALALAVDAEIRSWKAALQALAGSRGAATGPPRQLLPRGRRRRRPSRGLDLPLRRERPAAAKHPPSLRQPLAQDGRPRDVAGLLPGPAAPRDRSPRRSGHPAQPPRRRRPGDPGGRVLYALGMGLDPKRLVGLLADQRFPATWILGITDGRQRVVARVPDRPDRRGQPALPTLARALAAQDRRHGRDRARRRTGRPFRVRSTSARLPGR